MGKKKGTALLDELRNVLAKIDDDEALDMLLKLAELLRKRSRLRRIIHSD